MSNLIPTDPASMLLFLLEVTIKGSIVLAAAGLATTVLRSASAAIRHTIWTSAIAILIILPVFTMYTPSYNVRMLPAQERAVAPERVSFTSPATDYEPTSRLNHASRAEVAVAPSTSPPLRSETRTGSVVLDSAASTTPLDWRFALVALWAMGLVVVGFRYAVGWIALMRIKRRSEPVADVRLRLAAIRTARALGLTRRFNLVWGDTNGMPLTWGWVRPTILLPQEARDWEAERTLIVMRHELAHIKRWDCLIQAIVYVGCIVYWFNPLVWMAAAHSKREREIACDDYVITGGTRATEYADHLLDIARSLITPRYSGVTTMAMARQSELEGRLMAILSPTRSRRANTPVGLSATLVLLILVALPISAFRPVPVEIEAAAPSVTKPWASSVPADDVRVTISVPPVEAQIKAQIETEAFLAEVTAIVEKATRTLESLERLNPSARNWVDEFYVPQVLEESDRLLSEMIVTRADTLPLSEISRLKAAGVDVEFIEEFIGVGLTGLNVNELVALSHADVDADYVRELRSAGYTDLSPDRLIRLGFADVQPEDIAIWAELGYDHLTTDDLIRLSHAGVDADNVRLFSAIGYSTLTPEDLVRMGHADVDPDFVMALSEAGYANVTPNDLIRLGHADIDVGFIRAMRAAGFVDLTIEQLVRLGHADVDVTFIQEMRFAGIANLTTERLIQLSFADVDGDFVTEMSLSGLGGITVEELVRLSHADVDSRFVKEMRELGYGSDDVDEIIQLRYMGIDSEYVRRIRGSVRMH